MNSPKRLRRGDVIRVRFDPAQGAEQRGERPALIVSPDPINEHSPVVLVAAITSKRTESLYPFEVLLEPPDGGLSQRSKVLLIQLRAIDKQRIVARYGSASSVSMIAVDAAL